MSYPLTVKLFDIIKSWYHSIPQRL